MSREFAEELTTKLACIYRLTDQQVSALAAHYDLMLRWNRRINLTAIRTLSEVVERHYCESIFLAMHLPDGAVSVADVGSGAGFPGLPIAVMRAASQVTLFESRQRKAAFLKEAARDHPNVSVRADRFTGENGGFDWGVCRAVKWRDLEASLAKSVSNVALLSTLEEAPRGGPFAWEALLPLPWGQRRVLVVGSRFT